MFVKSHLKIDRDNFKAAEIPEGFKLVPVEPQFSEFIEHIAQIGDNWHLRQEFHETSSKKAVSNAIENGKAWLFKKHGVEIGFCYTIQDSPELKDVFRSAASDGQATEIYKVGLFPGHTGKGYGHFMVPAVLEQLFKSGADHVYLNTRDTNHVSSIHFYEKLGFEVFHTEALPDDLVPSPQRKLEKIR